MNGHPPCNLGSPIGSTPPAREGFDGSNEFEQYDWGARRPRWTTPSTHRLQEPMTGWAPAFDFTEWRGRTHHPLMNAWTRMRSWHGATSGTMAFPWPSAQARHTPVSEGRGPHQLGPAESTGSFLEAEAA